jgi:hypothetical protein
MKAAGAVRQPKAQPVLAMHRREDFDFRRPILWKGADMPAFSRRLAAPPKHEWLELVRYWKDGAGTVPVWFVADPQRTDLALVDRRTAAHRVYRWPVADSILLGGVRPNEMDWYVFDSPGWYLGEGWALTPEAAGVAAEDHRGPGIAPIEGWIRRRSTPTTLMVGGRNLASEASSLELAVDGKPVGLLSVPPGFFLRFVDVPEGAIDGPGQYAHLVVSARASSGGESRVAVEQFDAQPANVIAFGFGEGWHEMESNPVTGRSWRWVSERGVIRARGAQSALTLAIAGDANGVFDKTTVSIRIGNRVIGRWTVRDRFAIETVIPADALPAERAGETVIVVESDRYVVPAERSRRTQDRRHLALRVDEVRLTTAF